VVKSWSSSAGGDPHRSRARSAGSERRSGGGRESYGGRALHRRAELSSGKARRPDYRGACPIPARRLQR